MMSMAMSVASEQQGGGSGGGVGPKQRGTSPEEVEVPRGRTNKDKGMGTREMTRSPARPIPIFRDTPGHPPIAQDT